MSIVQINTGCPENVLKNVNNRWGQAPGIDKNDFKCFNYALNCLVFSFAQLSKIVSNKLMTFPSKLDSPASSLMVISKSSRIIAKEYCCNP